METTKVKEFTYRCNENCFCKSNRYLNEFTNEVSNHITNKIGLNTLILILNFVHDLERFYEFSIDHFIFITREVYYSNPNSFEEFEILLKESIFKQLSLKSKFLLGSNSKKC